MGGKIDTVKTYLLKLAVISNVHYEWLCIALVSLSKASTLALFVANKP